jgi:Skp family chaperone for outer membrane proteins
VADEREEGQERKGGGFASTVAKKALAPLVASAATAATAYLIRKATEIWEEKLRPKVQERGGGRAVARETLESAAGKMGPASEKLNALAEKLGDEKTGRDEKAGQKSSPQAGSSSSSDESREQERKEREQRRQQRRKALDQAGSS